MKEKQLSASQHGVNLPALCAVLAGVSEMEQPVGLTKRTGVRGRPGQLLLSARLNLVLLRCPV